MSGNGYFTNHRNATLRDNLRIVIILNKEEVGRMVCVAIILIGKNIYIDAKLKL